MNYSRSDIELIKRLTARLKFLEEDVKGLKHDLNYAGRVATDLRVLVVNKGSNKALLLDLAAKYGDRLEYQTFAPPHLQKQTTLVETLQGPYQSKYEGKIMHSNLDLIIAVANKEGAHEDQTFTDQYIETKSEEYNIGGYPAYIYQLIKMGDLVHHVGLEFLKHIES